MYTSFSLLQVITTGIPSQYFPIPFHETFISFENPKQRIPNSGAPEEFRTHFKNSWWRLGQCSDCSKRRIVLILSEKHWKTLQTALRSLKDRLTAGKADCHCQRCGNVLSFKKFMLCLLCKMNEKSKFLLRGTISSAMSAWTQAGLPLALTLKEEVMPVPLRVEFWPDLGRGRDRHLYSSHLFRLDLFGNNSEEVMAAIAQFVLCCVDPTQKDSQTNACFAKRTQDMTGYWTVAASHGLSFTRRSHNMFNHDHMITSLTIWSFHSVCWINGYFNPLWKLFKSQIPFVSAQLMDMSGALPWDSQPCPCSQCPRYSLLPIIVHDKLLREMIPLGRNPDFVWFSTFIRILPDLVCLLQAALNFHLAHVARKRWTTALHPKGNSNKENQRATNKSFNDTISWPVLNNKPRKMKGMIEDYRRQWSKALKL